MQIDFSIAKKMVQAANPYGNTHGQSVFFNLGDLKTVLEDAGLWTAVAANPQNYGIKIYAAKYDHNIREIKDYVDNVVAPTLNQPTSTLYGKSTVVLQLMDGTCESFILYTANGASALMAANLGGMCPPPWNKPVNDLYMSI